MCAGATIRPLQQMLCVGCRVNLHACGALQFSSQEQIAADCAVPRSSALDAVAIASSARARVQGDMRHCDETRD